MNDRVEEMTADGRRVGRQQGKRLAAAHGPRDGGLALRLAIQIEERTMCHDSWGVGYIEGLRCALREFEGRKCLRYLDQ